MSRRYLGTETGTAPGRLLQRKAPAYRKAPREDSRLSRSPHRAAVKLEGVCRWRQSLPAVGQAVTGLLGSTFDWASLGRNKGILRWGVSASPCSLGLGAQPARLGIAIILPCWFRGNHTVMGGGGGLDTRHREEWSLTVSVR